MKTQSKKVKIDFEKNKYVTIPKVFNKQTLDFIYSYIKIFAERHEIVLKYLPKYYIKEEHGYTGFGQVREAWTKYGDVMSDTLLLSMNENIGDKIGLELVPTYSFFRLYKNGAGLDRHTDRNACEISLSLCIGYEGEQWPLFINGTPIYQEPGDLVIYRGCDVEHWRNLYEGKQQAQIFLHYNNKNGPHGEKYLFDGRPFVGLPRIF